MHERACGTETIADRRDRGFHRGVGVAPLLLCLQPRDHSGVLTVELVAEAATRQAASIGSPARIVSIVSARVAAVLRAQRSRSAL